MNLDQIRSALDREEAWTSTIRELFYGALELKQQVVDLRKELEQANQRAEKMLKASSLGEEKLHELVIND